jgi:acetyl-CoA acetyltransferase
VSLQSPTFPDTTIDLPYLATDSAASASPTDRTFKESIVDRAYAEAGIDGSAVDVAEVYDLSTALELDWYEQIGICGPGEAEKLLHDGVTTIGGSVPVNPSGGLGAFGEAVPAQALAQVCELTWQLSDRAGARQVHGARVGVTANQGLFGHGSSVVLKRGD